VAFRLCRAEWSERLETGLNLLPPIFQEWRQGKLLAQALHGLIGREARPIGRDLQQDPARLAKVEAAKVEPVRGAWPAPTKGFGLEGKGPILGGTGKYDGAKGTVKHQGNTSDGVMGNYTVILTLD
jgi:hypothetical protein